MMFPDVSIVIPLYNAAKFIEETLRALQGQTHRTFEAIIVDDGSTDDSAKLVQGFCDCDPRLKLIRQSNSGVSVTRNRGAQVAKAPIIAFLDADDLWHPNFLEVMLRFMQQHPEVSVGFARTRFIDERGVATGATSNPRLKNLQTKDFLAGNPTTTCSNLVVRQSAFLSSGGFQSGLNHAEDQLWLLQMHFTGHQIAGLDQVLLDYRANSAGLSADTLAMGRGWEAMAKRAGTMDAARVGSSVAAARTINRLYLAQRALRTRRDVWRATHHIFEALNSDWRTAFSEVARRIKPSAHVIKSNKV